jgi:acyl dehydratase/NAD(P)-dependent dehydrogenase (short-subunit alcohol dehydrogenase family)
MPKLWDQSDWSGIRELGMRAFTQDDQSRFARLSGDHNPLHVDPLAARRLLYGVPVVHGVHVALWALDVYLSEMTARPVTSVDVLFVQPVFVGETVQLVLDRREDQVRLRIMLQAQALTTVRLLHGEAPPSPLDPARSAEDKGTGPRDLTIDDVAGLRGSLEVPADPAWGELLPAAAKMLSVLQVAEIGALSRLVGMECPGLHSLFGSLKLDLTSRQESERLTWEVTRVQPSHSALRMHVTGRTVDGNVTAFVRPRPVPQPAAADLAHVVERGEFGDMRALVIGASRGLGELASKLIAAGGGEVAVTWHHGQDEANAVAEDIRSAGGIAQSIQFSVAQPATGVRELQSRGWSPTHLFYFASPRITTRRTQRFDENTLASFMESYTIGFYRTLHAVRRLPVTSLVAFFPSTVAIEWHDPDLVEYAVAKAAGEQLARSMDSAEPWLRVITERLPPVATDQTATLRQDADRTDGVSLVLDLLRRAAAPAAPERQRRRAPRDEATSRDG